MPKKPAAKNKSSNALPLISRTPMLTRVVGVFVLLFVMGGGYYWYDTTHAASSPEVKSAMDGGKYCLDDHGDALGRAGNPAEVDAYTCNGSAAQHWTKGGGLIKLNGQCLDVYRGGKSNGTRVDLFPCNGSQNQQWRLSGSEIISAPSGKCLDIPSFQPNVSLDIWSCNGGSNQAWSWTTYNSGSVAGCGSSYEPSAGTAECIGQQMASSYGWGSGTQWSDLKALWNRESGWRWDAYNPSGAYGIPQALPGSKMGTAGSDWRTNAATQIKWGLGYIKDRWGSPSKAWANEECCSWY